MPWSEIYKLSYWFFLSAINTVVDQLAAMQIDAGNRIRTLDSMVNDFTGVKTDLSDQVTKLGNGEDTLSTSKNSTNV